MVESRCGPVAELADAYGLGPYAARREGSSPFRPTILAQSGTLSLPQ